MATQYFWENPETWKDIDTDTLGQILLNLSNNDQRNTEIEQQQPITQGLLTPPPQQYQLPQIEIPQVPQQPIHEPVDIKTPPKSLNEKIGEATVAATQGKLLPEILSSGNRLETNQPIQIDTSNKPPNPVYNELVQALGYAKLLYESAPPDEKGAAQRQHANQIAQEVRAQAEALGLDISQFGAENTNAQDVYRNISTQRGHDLMNLMQGGAFNKSADDFYRERYMLHSLGGNKLNSFTKALGSIFGFEDGDIAKSTAQEEARQYQAQRVAYLDGMLNAYGLDGTAGMNQVGHQIAGMIAQENPDLASYYLQRYPNANDRYNTLEDKANERRESRWDKYIDQAYKLQGKGVELENAIAQLAFSGQIDAARDLARFGYEINKMRQDYGYREGAANSKHARDKAMALYNSLLKSDEYVAKLKSDIAKDKEWTTWLMEHGKPELSDVEKVYRRGLDLAHLNGYMDEEADAIARQYMNTYFENELYGKGKAGGSSSKDNGQNKTVEYWNDYIGKLTAQRNSLIAPYKNELGMTEMPDDVKAQIASIDKEISDVQAAIRTATGMGSAEIQIPKWSDDEAQNVEILNKLYDASGGIWSEYDKLLRAHLTASGVTGHAQEQIMNEIKNRWHANHNSK